MPIFYCKGKHVKNLLGKLKGNKVKPKVKSEINSEIKAEKQRQPELKAQERGETEDIEDKTKIIAERIAKEKVINEAKNKEQDEISGIIGIFRKNKNSILSKLPD